jgi:crotonobetainyl-CoA:carnitine CoA-transferase CaiB-like acyl-CoA transferase
MSRTPPAVLRAGPTFGQDNEMILRDLLGLSADAMAGLVADGVIEG